tara:strand:+ start:1870 stop:2112 length:243 start_codon:yes stop_codon:yes gene_type:complete
MVNNKGEKEHISIVTEAIRKINEKIKLNDEDIREIFKSLMNGQIAVSKEVEDFEDDMIMEIDNLKDRIKKLEDLLLTNQE